MSHDVDLPTGCKLETYTSMTFCRYGYLCMGDGFEGRGTDGTRGSTGPTELGRGPYGSWVNVDFPISDRSVPGPDSSEGKIN